MARRQSSSSARPLLYAVVLCGVAALPVAFLLRDDGSQPPASSVTQAGGDAQVGNGAQAPEQPSAADPSTGVQLKPPPPGSRPPPPPRRAPSPPPPSDEEEAGPPASVRLVALRRLERKRPEETVDEAEALVRDTAAHPEQRSVLLGALGILHRVPGGDAALVRLSSDPPTPEVGQLANDFLMRPR